MLPLFGGFTVERDPGPTGAWRVRGQLDSASSGKLKRLLTEVGFRAGRVRVGRDWRGRPRVRCSGSVPEDLEQRIRNVLSNFDRL